MSPTRSLRAGDAPGELADVAQIAWAFDFTREQRAHLIRAAGLTSATLNRSWQQLDGFERLAICRAIADSLGVSETISGDLSG